MAKKEQQPVKEEEVCTVIQDILNEKIENSIDELRNRIKTNEHLSSCKNSKCNELRIHRINTGLY